MNTIRLTGIFKFFAISVILFSGLIASVNSGPVPSKKGENDIELTKRDNTSQISFYFRMYNGFIGRNPT